jgi:hypothetical protein
MCTLDAGDVPEQEWAKEEFDGRASKKHVDEAGGEGEIKRREVKLQVWFRRQADYKEDTRARK